jgi:cellulose synthase/poly-beta-1,6-N-acetylglucosamine synthase-like glycosyltransferase
MRSGRNTHHEVRVVALIPAHDEEEQIAATIASVQAQTYRVARIVVVADNCSDRTAEVALAAGAEVYLTVENRAKKAGALNQGMWVVDRDADYVLQMDGDTILQERFVEHAVGELEADQMLGGVCARFLTKSCTGLLPWLQRMEYQRLDRHTSHRRRKIHCLSGTATVLRRCVLRPQPWDERSLVEDYALSLDLLEGGWKIKRADAAIAWTETKPTLHEFWTQRLRWAKGTLDELGRRGWTPHTRGTILGHVWAYFVVLLRWLWVAAIVWSLLTWGVAFSKIWLLPLPVVLAERVRSVWPLGWRARTLAATWIADELYQLLWEGYMLHALWAACRRRSIAW